MDARPKIDDLEALRNRLTGYCYRMLGGASDTEDAVQETLIRAHRALDRFDPARGSLSTWVHKIATNICLDQLRTAGRRALSVDLGPAQSGFGTPDLGAPLPFDRFVEPMPDAALLWATDPAEITAQRQTVRLAFIAALQLLAPRQRAALLLRDVVSFSAAETADILDTTVAGANSALQRARARLAATPPAETDVFAAEDPMQQKLLDDYVEAFETHDIPRLTELIRSDARSSMPPFVWWLSGREAIIRTIAGSDACIGDRLIPVAINGSPGFGQYRLDDNGVSRPFALLVVEVSGGAVTHLITHLGTAERFAEFSLPETVN